MNKIYKLWTKESRRKNSEWKLSTNSKLQRKDFKLNYLKQLLKVKHSPYEQFAKLKVNAAESNVLECLQ